MGVLLVTCSLGIMISSVCWGMVFERQSIGVEVKYFQEKFALLALASCLCFMGLIISFQFSIVSRQKARAVELNMLDAKRT